MTDRLFKGIDGGGSKLRVALLAKMEWSAMHKP